MGQYPSRVRAAHPGCRHGLSGFRAMGYHLQAKQKAPKPRHPTARVVIGSGAGHFGRGLRRFDIHEGLLSAAFALAWQVSGGRVCADLQEFSPLAHRADHPSVPHDDFTTTHVRLQIFLPPFSEKSKRIYLPPRPKRIEKPILSSVCAAACSWPVSGPAGRAAYI